jgi:hypothetical protein
MTLTLRGLWSKLWNQEEMSENLTAQTPLRDAADFEEYKSLKNAPSPTDVKPAPASEPKTPSVPPAKPAGESAAAPEAAVTQDPEGTPPPRTDAERRIRQLAADKKRLEAELEELRKPKPAAAAPPATVEQPKPAAEQPATEDPKPTRKETIARLAQEHPTESYEQLLDRFDDLKGEWDQRQKTRETQERQRKDQAEVWQRTLSQVRSEVPDFDAKVFQNPALLMRPEAWRFAAAMGANGLRAIHEIGSDLAECARIAALEGHEQIQAVAIHCNSLTSQKGPEQPQPAPVRPVLVSRAPAPPRSLGGISPGEPTAPTNYDEYRNQKRKA